MEQREPPLGTVPRQRRSIETRDKVIDAAIVEFGAHGFKRARIEDIVAAAGVSRGTFFNYFPRKEDLLLAIAARAMTRVGWHVDEWRASHARPVRDVVREALLLLVDVPLPNEVLARSLQETLRSWERFEAMVPNGRAGLVPTLLSLVEEGQRRGEVRRDVPAQMLASVLVTVALAPLATVGLPARPGTTSLLDDYLLSDLVGTAFDTVWDGIGHGAVVSDAT